MKKLFLLLATGLVATASNGQQALRSPMFAPSVQPHSTSTAKHLDLSKRHNGGGVITATAAVTEGWFDYTDTVLANNIATLGASGDAVSLTSMYFWPDTTAIFGYDDAGTTGAIGYSIPSYGYSYNVTTGLTFDPFAPDWQTGGSGVSRPNITDTNAYTIDSILIVGIYGRQASAMTSGSYSDHLNFSLVYGDGTSTSNMPIFYFNGATLLSEYGLTTSPDSALWFPDLFCDTTNLVAAANPGTSGAPVPYTFSEALTYQDTSLALFGTYAYAVPGGGFAVPKGNFAALTVSFQSGDVSYAHGDSITSQDGVTYYHGAFSPAISFDANAGAAVYPPYTGPEPASGPINTGDYTTGYFKTLGSTDGNGWSPYYVPGWAYSSSAGGAYYLQFPYIMYHVTCPTCTAVSNVSVPVVKNAINEVKAYPNPATNVVNVAFTLSSASDVTVSLTNMVGQVVATQKVAGVSTGNVQFSTSALPDGMYFYTLNANSTLSTGRIVVAH